ASRRARGRRPPTTPTPRASLRRKRRPGEATGALPAAVSRIPISLALPRGGADDRTAAWPEESSTATDDVKALCAACRGRRSALRYAASRGGERPRYSCC